jgi:hypothetical protein
MEFGPFSAILSPKPVLAPRRIWTPSRQRHHPSWGSCSEYLICLPTLIITSGAGPPVSLPSLYTFVNSSDSDVAIPEVALTTIFLDSTRPDSTRLDRACAGKWLPT